MYQSDRFLEYANKHLKQKVTSKAIEEVKQIQRKKEEKEKTIVDSIRQATLDLETQRRKLGAISPSAIEALRHSAAIDLDTYRTALSAISPSAIEALRHSAAIDLDAYRTALGAISPSAFEALRQATEIKRDLKITNDKNKEEKNKNK